MLEMTLATDLADSQQGNALIYVNDAGTTISYNKLKAWDSTGAEILASTINRQYKCLSVIMILYSEIIGSPCFKALAKYEQAKWLPFANILPGKVHGVACVFKPGNQLIFRCFFLVG